MLWYLFGGSLFENSTYGLVGKASERELNIADEIAGSITSPKVGDQDGYSQ